MGNIRDLSTEVVEYANHVCEKRMTIAFSSVHV